jgi:predicted lipid-binding transport protein (Tim44 family)
MTLRRLPLCLALTLVAASLLLLAPHLAEARAGGGGSFGSRGGLTFSAPPPTATAPSTAAPIARSMTPEPSPSNPQGTYSPRPAYPGGFFSGGGFMAGLFGGMLGAGIGGLLFGHGFFGGINGFGSVLGLLLQLGIIYLLVRLAIGFFRNRAAARPAFGGQAVIDAPYAYVNEPPLAQRLSHSSPAIAAGNLAIGPDDFNAFEQLLGLIQADWSRADLASLRRHVTPEMLSYFAELLAANTSRGRENHVEQVKLEQGDLSEAWSEAGIDYATVAMRFSLLDWTIDQASGRVVEGDPSRRSEATEIWTFLRANGGHWLLSAIQQT